MSASNRGLWSWLDRCDLDKYRWWWFITGLMLGVLLGAWLV